MRARQGMTLVELVVAMTILSFVLLAMSGIFVVISRRASANDADLRRTALLQQSASFLEAIPFDSVPAKVKTDSVKIDAGWYVRQVSYTDSSASGQVLRVTKVRITPRATGKRDSIRIIRTKPSCRSVLNTLSASC